MRDNIFKSEKPVSHFSFDASVAEVFDDMLERSVPFYSEVQRMVVELAAKFIGERGVFYDVGCSTGNTMVALARALGSAGDGNQFVGLEPANAMREKASLKVQSLPNSERFRFIDSDVQCVSELPGARVITMLYTLQFIRPIQRLDVLKMCYRSLEPGGCLILAEKILTENEPLRHLFIDLYHQFKARSGYSALEIARKREALETVLIPFMSSEDKALLREAGFALVESVFQWYNFAVYLAVKQ